MENEFLCPISLEIMSDPVLIAGDADGVSYDRQSIERALPSPRIPKTDSRAPGWLASNDNSPLTGLVIRDKTLIPNRTLKRAIQTFLERNPPPPAPAPAPAKPSTFSKGQEVEHFREHDGVIRAGRVVGVHFDNPEEGAYYTVQLHEGEQELQAMERKLDLPGRWKLRLAEPRSAKFAVGGEVEESASGVAGTVTWRSEDGGVVDGFTYSVAFRGEGGGEERTGVREGELSPVGTRQARLDDERQAALARERAQLRQDQEQLRLDALRFEQKRRAQTQQMDSERQRLERERLEREHQARGSGILPGLEGGFASAVTGVEDFFAQVGLGSEPRSPPAPARGAPKPGDDCTTM